MEEVRQTGRDGMGDDHPSFKLLLHAAACQFWCSDCSTCTVDSRSFVCSLLAGDLPPLSSFTPLLSHRIMPLLPLPRRTAAHSSKHAPLPSCLS